METTTQIVNEDSKTKRGPGRPKLTDTQKEQRRLEAEQAAAESWNKPRVKVTAKQMEVRTAETVVYLPPPPASKGTPAWKLWAREAFKELLMHGMSFDEACRKLGVSRRWWEVQASRDPGWADEMRKIRSGETPAETKDYPDISGMTYSEFAKSYLGLEVFEHQMPIVEALQDPDVNRTMVLGFPESGKSTHVSLGYIIYSLCRNPDIRIALVSKSQTKAEDILNRVKRYLTEDHLYENTEKNLIRDFRGFEPARGTHRWDQTQITIRQRRSGERDPTIQALGIGSQIYGTRIDLLILDDSLTLENQLTEVRREKINSWFLQEAASRAHRGRVIVCGTRVHPFDNYLTWKKAWEGDEHFRLVKIPAILSDKNGIEVSGWPSYWPLDGKMIWDTFNRVERYQKGLRDIRQEIFSVSPMNWKLAYQQEEVQDLEAIFTMERHIKPALGLGINRSLGQVFPGEILVLGVDPAVTGRAAAVLLAYDPKTRMRAVVDVVVMESLGAEGLHKRMIYPLWEKYRPQRTVVEVNYAPTLFGDEAFKTTAIAYGTQLIAHSTTGRGHKPGSKWDNEYGVAAVAPLLSNNLFVLPSKTPEDRQRLQPLLEDMEGFPYSEMQDAVMALWFAEGELRYFLPNDMPVEQIIEGRQLPPRIANRLRRSGN